MQRTVAFACLLAVLACAGKASAQDTLAEALAETPELSTLLELVKVSNLLNATTDANTSVTVFAPTNEAFASALEALNVTAEALIANTELLNTALATHIVTAPVFVLKNGYRLKTLVPGLSLGITIDNGTVSVVSPGSTAEVLAGPIKVNKSVVYVIEAVLLPFNSTMMP